MAPNAGEADREYGFIDLQRAHRLAILIFRTAASLRAVIKHTDGSNLAKRGVLADVA